MGSKLNIEQRALYMVCTIAVYAAYSLNEYVSRRIGSLTIDSSIKTETPVAIKGDSPMYQLLIEKSGHSQDPSGINQPLELAFTRTFYKPEVPPPAPAPQKPDWDKSLSAVVNISAITDSGAFINGRYYRKGVLIPPLSQWLKTNVFFSGATACKARFVVAGEPVDYVFSDKCIGK